MFLYEFYASGISLVLWRYFPQTSLEKVPFLKYSLILPAKYRFTFCYILLISFLFSQRESPQIHDWMGERTVVWLIVRFIYMSNGFFKGLPTTAYSQHKSRGIWLDVSLVWFSLISTMMKTYTHTNKISVLSIQMFVRIIKQ